MNHLFYCQITQNDILKEFMVRNIRNCQKPLNTQIFEIRSDISRIEDIFEFKDMIKQFIFLVHWNQSRPDNKPLVISSDKWKNVWKDIVSTS